MSDFYLIMMHIYDYKEVNGMANVKFEYYEEKYGYIFMYFRICDSVADYIRENTNYCEKELCGSLSKDNILKYRIREDNFESIRQDLVKTIEAICNEGDDQYFIRHILSNDGEYRIPSEIHAILRDKYGLIDINESMYDKTIDRRSVTLEWRTAHFFIRFSGLLFDIPVYYYEVKKVRRYKAYQYKVALPMEGKRIRIRKNIINHIAVKFILGHKMLTKEQIKTIGANCKSIRYLVRLDETQYTVSEEGYFNITSAAQEEYDEFISRLRKEFENDEITIIDEGYGVDDDELKWHITGGVKDSEADGGISGIIEIVSSVITRNLSRGE